jgi:hypothetical protein
LNIKKNTFKNYRSHSDAEIDGIPPSEVDHIKSYIKNHPSERILLSTLPSNLKRKYSKEQYLPILQQLETDGHGTVTTTDNTTGPKAIVFVKRPRITTAAQSVTTAQAIAPRAAASTAATISMASASSTVSTSASTPVSIVAVSPATTTTDSQSTITNTDQ